MVAMLMMVVVAWMVVQEVDWEGVCMILFHMFFEVRTILFHLFFLVVRMIRFHLFFLVVCMIRFHLFFLVRTIRYSSRRVLRGRLFVVLVA